MKTKLIKGLLILIGAGALLAGCESSNQPTATLNPEFPPGPPTQANSP
jgi:hypothetical protein